MCISFTSSVSETIEVQTDGLILKSSPKFLSSCGPGSPSAPISLTLLLITGGSGLRHPNATRDSRERRWPRPLCAHRGWWSPLAQPHSHFGHKSRSPGPGGPPGSACCPVSPGIHLCSEKDSGCHRTSQPQPQWHISWPTNQRQIWRDAFWTPTREDRTCRS